MRVVAAMSGGVDSAVAASRMLEAGHEVVGVHLALSQSAATLRESARGCCTIEDAGDARRVADKLLHQPTVRVKQLANEQGAVSYAAALAELFALDPEAVDAAAVGTLLDAVTLVDVTRGDLLSAGAHVSLRSADAIHLNCHMRSAPP